MLYSLLFTDQTKYTAWKILSYCPQLEAVCLMYWLQSPLQAWTGPEGSRSLRLPDFKTVGTWRW